MVAVASDRPVPVVVGGFVVVWTVFSGLTLINPPVDGPMAVTPAVVFAVLFALALMYISGERLLVCERGLVIGSVAPGMRPYVLRYDQIVPGSVAPVTGAGSGSPAPARRPLRSSPPRSPGRPEPPAPSSWPAPRPRPRYAS